MMKRKVLVIEDEEDLVELIGFHMTREGFEVVGAYTGEEGLRLAREMAPDLIILDLMLPGMDGLEVCRLIKQDTEKISQIPIIMLTAKSEQTDIIAGLDRGADDYLCKPFSPRVFLAHVRAVLRRPPSVQEQATGIVKIKNFFIDPNRYQVTVDGDPVELTLTEFRLLHLLAQRPGWVFTRYQIVDAIRGVEYSVTERSVDVHIVSLRKKLGAASEWIETVRGVGYRFKE